jgi:Uma2 family endonuclease
MGVEVLLRTDPPRRLALTGDALLTLQASGALAPDHTAELIAGDLIEMPSEGEAHSHLKARLIWWFNRMLDERRYWVAPDTPLRLSPTDWPEPDLFVHASGVLPARVLGPQTDLVVEIADTSLAYDLGVKAALYRRFGVRRYWVIDLHARLTHDHAAAPAPDALWTVTAVPFGAPLEVGAELAPSLLVEGLLG